MVSSTELGKWAQDVKLDLIYYFECNLNQWLSSPQNHCISQLKSLLCLRKERLCRLNEFQSLNVFARHSGAKSYLMADTQFMAGPPFSGWQVICVTRQAFECVCMVVVEWGRRVMGTSGLHIGPPHSWKEEHKRNAWEMKWEKSSSFAHSTAAGSAQQWLADWLTDWLTGWLDNWLTGWLDGYMALGVLTSSRLRPLYASESFVFVISVQAQQTCCLGI